MTCGKCGSPTGAMIGWRCLYCGREGILAKLMWWLSPEWMRRVRWRQNLKAGGWW